MQQKKDCFPRHLYFDGCCTSRMPQKLRMSVERGNTNWGSDAWITDLVTTVTRVAGVAVPEGPVESVSHSVLTASNEVAPLLLWLLRWWGLQWCPQWEEQMRDSPQIYHTVPPVYLKASRHLHLKGTERGEINTKKKIGNGMTLLTCSKAKEGLTCKSNIKACPSF